MTPKVFPPFLDGQPYIQTDNPRTLEIESPYLEQVMGSVYALSKEEVDLSIHKAKDAQLQWRNTTIRERADLLFLWASKLEEKKEEIASMVMHEIGKGRNDSLKEVIRTADLIRFTAEEAIHMNGESMRGDNYPNGSHNKLAVIERVPLGLVLAISPFNYPVNLAAAKIAPAIMMGNGCIFKPASKGALSGWYLLSTLIEAGMPPNLVVLITGKGSEIGDYLVEHPMVSMISFTGGTSTGISIAKKAGMVPLVLELGGKDPAIICEDADIDHVANEITLGAYSYSGQRCTAVKRVLVHEDIADALASKLTEEVKKLTIGSPEENCIITPLIDMGSADYVQSLIDDAVAKGATVLHGNERNRNLIYPTLLDHVTLDMKVAWEEPFGPVLPIIRVKSDDEAIHIANSSEFGLQACIFTQDINRAFQISEKMEAGATQINGKPERGPDHFPFVSMKHSGMGIQGVRKSLESMSTEKVTVFNFK